MAILPLPLPELPPIPPLENGAHLSHAEFERRCAARPGLKRTELIEGVVYLPAPVSYCGRSAPHGRVTIWIGAYGADTPGTDFGDHGTVRLALDNEVQPDVFLWLTVPATTRAGLASPEHAAFVARSPGA